MFEKTYIVMPCFNEAPVLASVLDMVTATLHPNNIIVVNDGSHDQSGQIAESYGCHVLHHRVNRGLGAALQTGFALAQTFEAEVVVTFDADGQHHIDDVAALIAHIEQGAADVVIGSRFLDRARMPLHRRFFNWLGNCVTWLFHGAWVSDSQSGLRAFSRKALANMRISANTMDVSSEFIREVHRLQLRLVEVPIRPVYTAYSLSKGQSFLGGVRTLTKIILRKYL